MQTWHLVALGRDPHSWPRARPHVRLLLGGQLAVGHICSGGRCRRQLRPRKDRTRHAAKNMLHAHHAAYHGCQVRRGQDTVAGGQRERHDNAGHACGRAGRGVARALLRVDRRRGARLPCKRGALRWGRTRLQTPGLIRLGWVVKYTRYMCITTRPAMATRATHTLLRSEEMAKYTALVHIHKSGKCRHLKSGGCMIS